MVKLGLNNLLKRKSDSDNSNASNQTQRSGDFEMKVDLLGYDKAEDISKLDISSSQEKLRRSIQARLGVDTDGDYALDDLEAQRQSIGLEVPVDENSKEAKEQKLVSEVTLVTELTETERRVQYEAIARIERLMFQMRQHPDTIEDFLDFAKESSNTETSISFMESLYYYTQSSSDTKVIVELARLSATEMFSTIDDIVEMKMNKIDNLPGFIIMLALIPIFAILVTFLVTVGISAFGSMM